LLPVKQLFILTLVAAPTALLGNPQPGAALYEEDILASSPIRVAQWRQMEAYADSLPESAPGAGSAPAGGAGAGAAGLRAEFRRRLGYPAPGFTGRPQVRLERVGEDAVATTYRCWIRSTPLMETYGLYIVPRGAGIPAPLVIAVHGGGGFPELATFHGGSNYHDMVRGAVAAGYVTYVPLSVMYPYHDRDHGTPIPRDVRERLDARLKKSGTTLMGVEVTKFMRALDVLEGRPEVDPGRVAMIGLSYGGFYTLYAAALDSRIRASVAACCFRDPNADATAVPRAVFETGVLNSCELAELVSPRALQVQSGIGDPIFPIAGARRAAELARAFYPGSHASDFEFQAFAGGHEFKGDVAWAFLRRELAR
jgi:dienelactone hydrolase